LHKHQPVKSVQLVPYGSLEFYKLSLDEYDESSNSYLNLLPQFKHISYGQYQYGWGATKLSDYFSNYVGSEFQLGKDVNLRAMIPVEAPLKEEQLFFAYEKEFDYFPEDGSGEIVIKGYRYYYQPAQNVTVFYPYIAAASTGAARTITYTCKAGWYPIANAITFPTGKAGYAPNRYYSEYLYGQDQAQYIFANNTYTNGSSTWVYTDGQWLRYQASNPLTHATTYTNVLKYVNNGGYRKVGSSNRPSYDLIPIETFNNQERLFEFGPSDINLSDNSITVNSGVGLLLRTGMKITFAPSNDNIETVFPTIKYNPTPSGTSTISWPRLTRFEGTYFVESVDSTTEKPKILEFRDTIITSYYIEKISETKIKLWPNYDDRIAFGQNQKPLVSQRYNGSTYGDQWPHGFYEQPYYSNQQNKSKYEFVTVGSGYKFYCYRFYEKYPNGTALIPISVEGAYPAPKTNYNDVDYGAMFWSWLDSRYVDLTLNRIKCTLNTLPNYNRESKNYTTGTKITVRVARTIIPMANVARAKYAFSENVPTLYGELTIQGAKLVSGDYVLLLGQTNSAQKHLYRVSTGSWDKSFPVIMSAMVAATFDVASYYEQIAVVGVDKSFANDEKYTVYSAKFKTSGTFDTAWKKEDHDGTFETPNFKQNYFGFNTSFYSYYSYPSVPDCFELKGFSQLPSPLIDNGTYYLIKDGEYVSFAASYDDAINNIPIPLTSMGKGILVINNGPKSVSAYLEKIISENPLITEVLDEKALFLINLPKGRFQIADTKANALAKIPIKLNVKPNDNFALYKAYNDSLPTSSIFTRDQKFFGWDVDNPNNTQFQRPVPKFLDQDACDVPGILSSNLTINFDSPILRADSAKYPFYKDSPWVGYETLIYNRNPFYTSISVFGSTVAIDDFILIGGKTYQQVTNENTPHVTTWNETTQYAEYGVDYTKYTVIHEGTRYYVWRGTPEIGKPPSQDPEHWMLDRFDSILEEIQYAKRNWGAIWPSRTEAEIAALPEWDANTEYGQYALVKFKPSTFLYWPNFAYIRYSDDPRPSKGLPPNEDTMHWGFTYEKDDRWFFPDRTYGDRVIPTTIVPPTTFLVNKLGITSSSSWVPVAANDLANLPAYKFIHRPNNSSNYDVTRSRYRSYTTTNTQSIIDAVLADLMDSVNWGGLKFYKWTSTNSNAYKDTIGGTDSNVVSDSATAYISKGSITRSYDCTVNYQEMTQPYEEEYKTEINPVFLNRYSGDGGPAITADTWYSKKTFVKTIMPVFTQKTIKGQFLSGQLNYTVSINNEYSYKLDSGVDVGVPGRYTTAPFPQPQRTSRTAKITAFFNVSAGVGGDERTEQWRTEFTSDCGYTVIADYNFDGTSFVKVTSTDPHSSILPSTFTVDIEEYYFPRTALKLDFDSPKHIWKKSFITKLPANVNLFFEPGITSDLISSADFAESSLGVTSISLPWNASQKRYQSTAMESQGVKFRCEALIGQILEDKQLYQDRVANDLTPDYYTVSLFGSPNTWIEFTAFRLLKTSGTTTTVTNSHSDSISFLLLEPLKLSRYVSAANDEKNPNVLTQINNGYESVYDHPIFGQFSAGVRYNPQPLLNNGYELAICDIPLNRHPLWDIRNDMDVENFYNQVANQPNNATINNWQQGYTMHSSEKVDNFIAAVNTTAGLPAGTALPNTSALKLFSIPTVTIVTTTGTGGKIEVITSEGVAPYGSYSGLPKFYYLASLKITGSGQDYVGSGANRDYLEIVITPAVIVADSMGRYTSITAGTPVTYRTWITTGSPLYPISFSSLYPYRSLGLDGKNPVPHIAAPVTIGLIKKISFE
jgi:hypothetical protein